MNPNQPPFLVEGVLILATMLFGFLLDRGGKPYGKVKLVIHLFLYLWFTIGFAFIAYGLSAVNTTIITWIPVTMMGLFILTLLVTGVLMLAAKQVGKPLTTIHLTSAILLLLADMGAFFVAGSLS